MNTEQELKELRQAVWDARATLGFDNSGNPTPDALKHPTLAELVKRDAAEFRKDYDDALLESCAIEANYERLVEAASAVANAMDDDVRATKLAVLRGVLMNQVKR